MEMFVTMLLIVLPSWLTATMDPGDGAKNSKRTLKKSRKKRAAKSSRKNTEYYFLGANLAICANSAVSWISGWAPAASR